MPKKIFIWVAHPKAASLCEGIADAYQTGAEAAGSEVRRMDLSAMTFDPTFDGYKGMLPLEPDLQAWQDAVSWADHVLFVHPYWWGAMPTKAGVKWDKLLSGKTADAIITADTPTFIDTLLYNKPARRVIKNQVFGFCGLKAKNVLQFGSVKLASDKKINGWITRAGKLGAQAAA